jgi:rubredoxin
MPESDFNLRGKPMSTIQTNWDCPRCGAKDGLTRVDDAVPSRSFGYCLECGFHYETLEGVHSLGEVNEMREESDLPPLATLALPLSGWE